ncbi:uncharacterized protein LOC107177859 [Citrus sinensis]|uniref:uncharacterized protein LOC107177859 n=1 Tax=Citrus sinensis TaxID=2711 RepID=UPI0007638A70|nr:uncharacterized protein LOC107177859 [Citrus sinensis]XP_024041887.1 uncharacterized protein LOC112099021 [Citrus x clementina]
MANSEILSALQTLQATFYAKLDGQQLSIHQTIQQFMTSVDSRFEELRTELHGSSNKLVGAFNISHPSSSKYEGVLTGSEVSPVLRSMKMDVPKFDGSDPNGWIFRIEEFFDFHDTPEILRLRIVSFHMEGRAAAWYQWMKNNHLLTTWQEFLANLRYRFGASLYEDPQGDLSKLSQTTTVADFQSAFEDLMNKVTGISEPLLISFFITGLKPNIRRELLFSRPSSLMETFALARTFEAKYNEVKQSTRSWPKWQQPYSLSLGSQTQAKPIYTSSSPATVTTASSPASSSTLPSQTHNTNKPNTLPALLPTPTLPIRRLSPAELREKREKGLCYNCDKKYSSNHRCRNKFLLLMGTDDEELDPQDNEEPSELVDDGITGDISSLNALAGQANPRSLRLIGEIDSHTFQVLIDSGSTHNFIKPALAERLGLAIQPTTNFRVYIGNGDFLVCKQVCPQANLTMQGSAFIVDLFILPIEGIDVVLGIQWLQKLGKVFHDYSALTMEFFLNGQPVMLRGDLSSPTRITYNQLQALIHSDTVTSLCALQPVPVIDALPSFPITDTSSLEFPSSLSNQFLNLLQHYKHLFL